MQYKRVLCSLQCSVCSMKSKGAGAGACAGAGAMYSLHCAVCRGGSVLRATAEDFEVKRG